MKERIKEVTRWYFRTLYFLVGDPIRTAFWNWRAGVWAKRGKIAERKYLECHDKWRNAVLETELP